MVRLPRERYDVVVIGATPGGIAASVRAAREGLRVLLVADGEHLGGVITSGLGAMDTLYDRPRAPLADEVCGAIREYYRTTYGEDSAQYADATRDRHLRCEPHVGERLLTALVEREERVTVLRSHRVVGAEVEGRRVRTATLEAVGTGSVGSTRVVCAADTFMDCTYEGDLAALAEVPYRVGREGREEHGEPHAGRIFTTHGYGHFPREAHVGRLNLATFPVTTQEVFAGSTGEGDRAIQAYNYRFCLTTDPGNRRMPERPAGYDRTRYLGLVEDYAAALGKRYPLKSQLILSDIQQYRMRPVTARLPNEKISWNEPVWPGGNHGYPEGTWEVRQEILRAHRDHALGMLYFLQHDEAVPEHVREEARRWGLATDEFADNDNVPYEIYVREARRIVGRYVFTEHDGTLAQGLERAPVHEDAIAFAEWPMDSHECTTDQVYGSLYDGKFLLSEKTRPSHIPYRTLLPEELDNLLVPVCLSATHVAWGTIRLEPTWMHIGEAAGHAAALAASEGGAVGTLRVDRLQRRLVERGVMLSFFNDADLSGGEGWEPAVQYLGTKGLFASYDARPEAALTEATAKAWADVLHGRGDASSRARAVRAAEESDGGHGPGGTHGREGRVTGGGFGALLIEALGGGAGAARRVAEVMETRGLSDGDALTRGDAARVLYALTAPAGAAVEQIAEYSNSTRIK